MFKYPVLWCDNEVSSNSVGVHVEERTRNSNTFDKLSLPVLFVTLVQ